MQDLELPYKGAKYLGFSYKGTNLGKGLPWHGRSLTNGKRVKLSAFKV